VIPLNVASHDDDDDGHVTVVPVLQTGLVSTPALSDSITAVSPCGCVGMNCLQHSHSRLPEQNLRSPDTHITFSLLFAFTATDAARPFVSAHSHNQEDHLVDLDLEGQVPQPDIWNLEFP
jgi:hypothetical protein